VSGTLPSQIGNLGSLEVLDLGKYLELVFQKSFLELVWMFVVLSEEGLNRF